jgi:hypothetical protein
LAKIPGLFQRRYARIFHGFIQSWSEVLFRFSILGKSEKEFQESFSFDLPMSFSPGYFVILKLSGLAPLGPESLRQGPQGLHHSV